MLGRAPMEWERRGELKGEACWSVLHGTAIGKEGRRSISSVSKG